MFGTHDTSRDRSPGRPTPPGHDRPARPGPEPHTVGPRLGDLPPAEPAALVAWVSDALRRRGWSPEDAEDDAQEAMVRWLEDRSPVRSAAAWMLTVAARIGITRARGPRVRPLPAEVTAADPAADERARAEAAEDVRAALARLPDTWRKMLELYANGATRAAIAAAFGCHVNTVQARLNAARRRLRDRLAG